MIGKRQVVQEKYSKTANQHFEFLTPLLPQFQYFSTLLLIIEDRISIPKMSLQSDYVDYDVFLDPNFSPISFANSLILSTNSPNDQEIDLKTPAKRLGYDLEEVQQRISQLTSQNHETLMAEGSNIVDLKNALQPLKPAVNHLTSSYAKLQRDILGPYYKALHIHGALKRLHTTTGLLRSLTWFLYLARQLTSILDPISAVPTSAIEAPRNSKQANLYAIPNGSQLLRAAQTLNALRQLLVMEPALRSVQIIRTYETSFLNANDRKLILHCQNILRFYSPASAATIGPNTPGTDANPVDDYDTMASHAAQALSILDNEALISSLSKFIQNQAHAVVTEMSRALPSLNLSIQAFKTSCNIATDRAVFLGRYEDSLKNSIDREIIQLAIQDAQASYQPLPSSQVGDSRYSTMVSEFWREFSSAIEGKIREFTNNNSNMTKTIRFKNYPKSAELVNSNILQAFEKSKDSVVQASAPDPISIRQISRSLAILFR